MSTAASDARAEAAAAVEDLQQRLEKEEKLSEQYKKQLEVLQSKLDDTTREAAKLEEKVHENEEHVESLQNEKREATRQIREMESIYEAERSSILKEKEEMGNREEEMQTVIQRLKDSLAQRNNGDDDVRPSRQGMCFTLGRPDYEGVSNKTFQQMLHLHSTEIASHLLPPSNAATHATIPNLFSKKTNSLSH
jgi:DNA repair exonuclease SbcCD ATPase subunit